LTDPIFARRLKDLMNEKEDFTLTDIHLLKIRRHFGPSKTSKAIAGRKEQENRKLMTFGEEGDWFIQKKSSLNGFLILLKETVDEEIK